MDILIFAHYSKKRYLLSRLKKKLVKQKLARKFANKKNKIKVKKSYQFKTKFLIIEFIQKYIFNFWQDFFSSFYLTGKHYTKHVFASLFLTFLIITCTFFIHELIFKDLPNPSDLTKKNPSLSTKILDRNGEVLYRIYDEENRSIVPLSEVSKYMIQATIAIEDKDFFSHHGFSVKGITRAFISNMKSEQIQGGSTITQQLVKNRLLTNEKTLTRKIKELLLSVLVENTYNKQEILTMYLNQVAYGGSHYGVEEASQRYFGKSAKELNLAESSLLAGLPQAPSVYSPFGANPELSVQRQEEVLRRMVEDNYITEEQKKEALATPLVFNTNKIDIKAPHFVMYVRKLLASQYGEDFIATEGLSVRTTLDLELQKQAEEIITKEVQGLTRLNVKNGAAVISNPKTGEILSMVGSVNYFDFKNDGQVNVTTRPRQPGSSIKPLTYALAFEAGKSPSTIIEDTPITYQVAGSKPYAPKNYDGKFHGLVTLREALASSYNIPAVKLLAEIGLKNMIDKAEEIGISTWKDRSRFGLSLTLGGGEVLMTEMAELYGSFANQGRKVDLNPILEIKDNQGKVLYQNECASDASKCVYSQVFSPEVAYLITNVLSDNNARTPAFGPMSTLTIKGQEVAVKTGTTNDLRDNWTFGYTTDHVVSVWVGNNDNSRMSYIASGITGASPIWNKLVKINLDEANPHKFEVPENIATGSSCFRANKTDVFVKGKEVGFKCRNFLPKSASGSAVPSVR